MCYKGKLYDPSLGALTRHHRIPKSRGGIGLSNNISHVPEKLHRSYHTLFANHLPEDVARILNEHWVSNDYHMVAVLKSEMKEFRQCGRCGIYYRVTDKQCTNC